MAVQVGRPSRMGVMTQPLHPICQDCCGEPRAPRSRSCHACRTRRKAANRAASQKQNRDARRALARPVSVPRAEAAAAVQAAREALEALRPLREHLLEHEKSSRKAREGLRAIDQTVRAVGGLMGLLDLSRPV